MNETPRTGDLVITPDGYYGIVTDEAGRAVFSASGIVQRLDKNEWAITKIVPSKADDDMFGTANFIELVENRMGV